MAEYRSYARQGQFTNRIQAPNTAKAKRDRDKEFVKELKDENQALKDRDAKFLAAYQEKLANEKVYRKEVEKNRRYSVERERAAIVANAKATADNAELERQANQETWEAVADMIPKVGTAVREEKERRDKFEKETADAAIRRTGFTPEEIDEYRQVAWTTEVLASAKYKILNERREAAGMSADQFIRAIQGQGIWGRSLSQYELIKKTQALSSLLSEDIANGWTSADGTTLAQAMTGEVPGMNQASVIQEWWNETQSNTYSEFEPRFVEETVGEAKARFLNSILAKGYENQEKQAIRSYNEGRQASLLGNLSAKNSWQATQAPYSADKKEHYIYLQNQAKLVENLITTDGINDDQLERFYNTQVWNPSLNKGKGGMNAIKDDSRFNFLFQAEMDKRRKDIQNRNVSIDEYEQQRNLEWTAIHKQIFDAPPDQQEQIIRDLINSDINLDHKSKLNRMLLGSTSNRNREIQETLDHYRRNNIPVTQSLIDSLRPTGDLLRQMQTEARAYETQGYKAYDAEIKKDFDKMIKIRTKTKHDDGQTGSDKNAQILRLMTEDYRRRRAAYSHLGPEKAHNQARNDVEKIFDNGVNPNSEGYSTNLYQYKEDPQNPLNSSWPNAGQGYEVLPEPPKLSTKYDLHGDNIGNVANSVFTTQQLSKFSAPNKVTYTDWVTADKVALLTSKRDTGAHIIKQQMEASGMEVPVWLNEVVNAHDQLISASADNRRVLLEAHKPGVDPRHAAMNLKANFNGAEYSNLQREIATWSPEFRMNHAISAITAFRLERHRVYGVSAEPVRTRQTFNLAVREFAPGGTIHLEADDDRYEPQVHSPTTDHGKLGMGTMDIPVANTEQAQFVINHFSKYGFKWIWNSPGHYTHVHLYLPNFSAAI